MKLPITSERIREAQAELERGNQKGAIEKLRQAREILENYERNLDRRKPVVLPSNQLITKR